MIRVILFDLDGVVRHFDPSHVVDIENRHGISPGAIENFAFGSPLIEEVTTGRITRRQWIARIADHLGNAEAADEWAHQPYTADPILLDLVDELRVHELTTAILTNGTDTIPSEVEQLGISAHFAHIFNSASIGFIKPDRRAFQHVIDTLEVPGDAVFFTDDSIGKLSGAAELGMTTHHYEGVPGLRAALHDSCVLTST
jgi:putative hydrolase of the HAD superfamily